LTNNRPEEDKAFEDNGGSNYQRDKTVHRFAEIF
jgi:hypothetical protein